jgi:hypothetical protein
MSKKKKEEKLKELELIVTIQSVDGRIDISMNTTDVDSQKVIGLLEMAKSRLIHKAFNYPE